MITVMQEQHFVEFNPSCNKIFGIDAKKPAVNCGINVHAEPAHVSVCDGAAQ